MGFREATADEICREIARETWKASAKVYGTLTDEAQLERLFQIWWRRNGSSIVRRVGHKFYEGVDDAPNLAPRVPRAT